METKLPNDNEVKGDLSPAAAALAADLEAHRQQLESLEKQNATPFDSDRDGADKLRQQFWQCLGAYHQRKDGTEDR